MWIMGRSSKELKRSLRVLQNEEGEGMMKKKILKRIEKVKFQRPPSRFNSKSSQTNSTYILTGRKSNSTIREVL
jgi:recombination DNA repair RAD52 pathway protein